MACSHEQQKLIVSCRPYPAQWRRLGESLLTMRCGVVAGYFGNGADQRAIIEDA